MISVSSNYKTNATKPVRNVNAKISIGTVDFGIDDIVSFELSRSPSDGGLSVGGTAAARLTATIRATMLPTMDAYKITASIGFTALTQIGTFYITDLTQEKGYVSIEAYDRFYYLDKPCSFNGSADGKVESLSFPATHQKMLEYISKINGFSLSVTCEAFAKVKTKPIYNSEATNPTNKYYTYREIIGFIAACNGCNAQFDANDKLIFARPSNSVETIEEGACESLSVAQDSGFTVKGIRFTIGTDTAFYIDANGTTYDETLPGVLEAVNPLATVEIMEYVWNKLGGYHYYAADISRRGRGWLLPDDVISIQSNGATKKATITAISYSLSKDSGFSEHITSTAESTEQSSNRYSAAGDHTSNVGAGKYNSTTIINDPVIISEKTKEYLQYNYSIVAYNAGDKITYGIADTRICIQNYIATRTSLVLSQEDMGCPYGNIYITKGYINLLSKVNFAIYENMQFSLELNSIQESKEDTYYRWKYTFECTKNGEYYKETKQADYSSVNNTKHFTTITWKRIFPPTQDYPCGFAEINVIGWYYPRDNAGDGWHHVSIGPSLYVEFANIEEYNSAVKLLNTPIEKSDVTQAVSKIIEAGKMADFPELGENDVLYIDSSDNSAYKWSSKISAYYCVGRDYFSIKQIQSVAEPNSSEAEILEAQLLQDMRSPAEWTLHSSFVPPKGYMCITDFESGQHGIKIGDGNTPWSELLYVNLYDIDLSEYLKTGDISDWAKANEKPAYTASEIGLGNVDNTADKDKPISTATQTALDGKADTAHTHRYDASENIAGQTIDLDDLRLNEDTDKGTVHRYSCGVSAAQNITNRPTAVNEPFFIEVRNIKSAATSYVTQQKYISPSRRKEYVRWCADGVWSAWQATDNRTIYGTIAPGTERSYAYTTYGEGYGKIKLTAMYGADEGSNMVNIKAATLVSDSAFERNMLTVGASVFKINITDGNVTLSVAEGTASFSYELMYFN